MIFYRKLKHGSEWFTVQLKFHSRAFTRKDGKLASKFLCTKWITGTYRFHGYKPSIIKSEPAGVLFGPL